MLGPRQVTATTKKVRAFLPNSKKAWVIHGQHTRPMTHLGFEGLYEADIPVTVKDTTYQLQVENNRGQITTMHDPYAFMPMLGELDLHLFGEGRHYEIYDRLGAHIRTVDGVQGVNFAVWAPNAQGISVVGDFNEWDGRGHAMQKHVPAGIWELFIPGMKAGDKYKFRVLRDNGGTVDKTDPYGFAQEL
ncbi:MAG: 1,4-alpha-glucan branching enzyme, partial [Bacteroidota bacterium]